MVIHGNSINVNSIQYESRGDKILTLTEYLDLIEKYLIKIKVNGKYN